MACISLKQLIRRARQRPRGFLRLIVGVVVLALFGAPARAQYYNSDAGHSLRVEDATPQPFRALSLDLFNGKAERLTGGTARYRYEPALDWGILPNTEIGVRFPLILIQPTRTSALSRLSGLGGIALGATRALTVETPRIPALAVATEFLLPVGSLAADQASFAFKALATKRFGLGRLHLNLGGGTYSIRTASTSSSDATCDQTSRTRFGDPFQGSCDDPPVIVDAPCSRTAADEAELMPQPASLAETPLRFRNNSVAAVTGNSTVARSRWSAAVGFDHAFALRSTSVGIDYVAEKFNGLYALVDQTAEFGFRTQAAPSTVMHGAISWHFAGVVQSVSVGAGVTMELAWPLFHRRAPK